MKQLSKYIAVCLLLLVLILGCALKKEVVISGKTMGTTYQIKIISSYFDEMPGIKDQIEERLKSINQSMSTYLPDSEISRFNALGDTETKLPVSNDFLKVMMMAKGIYEKSNGAWDGTVKPLVNLWGFGSTERKQELPNDSAIEKQLKQVGFRQIGISPQGYLYKKNAGISLNLASIAKGYAVDQISNLIRSAGKQNFLVEIGGEVLASGSRKDGKPWRVGINRPSAGTGPADIYQVVPLSNQAMATSGDYRNFFESEGLRYSHIIDPRNGYPVANGVVSVSILAKNCMFADGLATAIMVMGLQQGMDLINSLNDVEGFIIVQELDNTLTHHATKGFQSLLD